MAGKVLVAFEKMPDRATSAERVAAMDADVREAAAKCKRKIEDYSQRFTAQGYVLDDDSWEMALGGIGSRTIVLRATIRRPN